MDMKALQAKWAAEEAQLHSLIDHSQSLGAVLCAGKVFSLPVADGKAFYVVLKVNKRTVNVMWHSFGDGYQDAMLGAGGTFPREPIERRVLAFHRLNEIFKPVAEY